MNTGLLDEDYFCWLYRQVAVDTEEEPSRTYWRIFKKLHTKEFFWFVPKDDNRIEDGKLLRHDFMEDLGLKDVDNGWLHLGCSVFELLIGLSRRLAFLAGGEPHTWFWHLMENLGFEEYNDNRIIPEGQVEEVLNQIIFRTYSRTGRGGLFPLHHPEYDQRIIEIWYQMSAYIEENEQ